MKVNIQKKTENDSLWERLYIATVADDHEALIRETGCGIEIDEFTFCFNMEEKMAETERQTEAKLERLGMAPQQRRQRAILHGPFNEVFPAAMDPGARRFAMQRLNEGCEAAFRLGIRRMVVHAGFVPNIYYPQWQIAQASEFWKKFLQDKPEDFCLMIENVLDEEPDTLAETICRIDDPRVFVCFDVGHANCVSRQRIVKGSERGTADFGAWINVLGPYISHVHLHDNNGIRDTHLAIGKGDIDFHGLLEQLEPFRPTYTLESIDGRASLQWLREMGG